MSTYGSNCGHGKTSQGLHLFLSLCSMIEEIFMIMLSFLEKAMLFPYLEKIRLVSYGMGSLFKHNNGG